MKKYIKTNFSDFLNEAMLDTLKSDGDGFPIKGFPEDIQKTLSEYDSFFKPKFDWNAKQDEFNDNEQFSKWLEKSETQGLKNNIDTVLEKINEDISVLKAKEESEKKLKAFEELILPALDKGILTPELNDRQYIALMDIHASLDDIAKGIKDGGGILDNEGNVDPLKLSSDNPISDIGINLPAFESFVEENPEFQGVFDDWYKLFNEHTQLVLKDLNAFRSSIRVSSLEDLKAYLEKFVK